MEVEQIAPGRDGSCRFTGEDGTGCQEAAAGERGLCFWHDPEASKEGPEVKQRLEEWAHGGRSMEGFQLRFAHLEGIRLGDQQGRVMRGANLFRARLQGASLYSIDLRNAQLLKADLTGANLNDARLEEADLLGAIFESAKLERVEWGRQNLQEMKGRQAEREDRLAEARILYEEAEEVYRSLRQVYDNAGRADEAGRFFQREMTMRRLLMPQRSLGRGWSKLVDMVCGYGENPGRVIWAMVVVVLVCAALQLWLGVNTPDGPLKFDPEAGVLYNFWGLMNCAYYSIVTFATLGYGDFAPLGWGKLVASAEAFVGAFILALVVTAFGKKMMR